MDELEEMLENEEDQENSNHQEATEESEIIRKRILNVFEIKVRQ